MKHLLHLISSPRGEASDSNKLADRIIEKLQIQYPDSTVKVNNIADNKYPHPDRDLVSAYKTPQDNLTAEQKNLLHDSDTAIEELQWADIIVISLPLYNFSLPSTLKAWIDHVVRPGKTFSYGTGQPEGLLKHKKVYLAIASNGVYSSGPWKPFDFAEPYLRFILGFIGITDITTYRVEGSGMAGVKEAALQKGLESVAV